MSVTVITSHHCAMHDMDPEHPECPQRLYAVNDQIIASGLDFVVQQGQASKIEKEKLYLAHDKNYVDELFAKSPEYDRIWLDDDTIMMPGTLNAALYAAGSGINGVDKVMQGSNEQVFCNVRPPGHHAEKDKAMGFCFFNNIAVAAAYALEHYGLQRVAIFDFDVHHGNGTENIFDGDPRVLFCSCFQHPFYPFKGDGAVQSNILNQPLPAGTDSTGFREAVEGWFSAAEAFRPELVLISAGFDAHREDELGQFRLSEADFEWVTGNIKAIAKEHCQGRVVSMLEGGYALGALGRSVVAHLNALMK